MKVADLPLPARVRDHFEERGIESLYPPQAAAVDAGILEGECVVAAVPTASGKTLTAQLAMVSTIEREASALYVVPLRALATEKYETFAGLPGVDVGISTGEYDASEDELAEHDVIVATSEKVDAAIRTGADWVRSVGCVVVDEIHLLDDARRGPTLEVTIAKLRRLTPDVQLVGLSATIPNAAEIAAWLDASLVESDWRPVDLRTGVYADEAVVFDDGTRRAIPAGDERPTTALVADALDEGGQCLVFVRSRREAQRLASRLADEAYHETPTVAERIRETAATEMGRELAAVAASGVAFHHAGLRSEHRSVVESAFRDRQLRVICATPTLAAGVNVPARRVVVRDHRRYTDDGLQSLPVLEVHQMFGRAGRPGLDPYGEAMIVATASEAESVRNRYLEAEPEPVRSKLASRRALRNHVLATVASGDADSRDELEALLATTFYAHQHVDDADLGAITDDVLASLESSDMLTTAEDGGLVATDLGSLVSRVYVDPITGADVVAALERASEMDRVTRLTVLELICDTTDMPTLYVRGDEAGRLSEYAMRNDDELTKSIAAFDGNFQSWLGTFKTARLLDDWVDGIGVDDLGERYGVGPGDVRRHADRAEWLLGATESIAAHVESDLCELIGETRARLAARSV